MLCRLQKSAFLFAFKLNDVCAEGNFQPLNGSDKVQVPGSWAHYWSTCIYSYPVLDGTGNSMKLMACLTRGCGQEGSAGEQQSWHLLIQSGQWLVEGLFSPPVMPDSFLDRYLCGKSITHTAGLGQYSWSQSCLLKWVMCCWCSSNPGTIGVIMWNCSYVVMGSLRTAAVTLLLSSYSWAAVSPLHLWREDTEDLLSRCHESKPAWLKSSSTSAYTGLREAGMEGYKEEYLCFPEAEIPIYIQNLWWLCYH